MNIAMSTFRLQLIDRHLTFLSKLIVNDNRIRQPENTFSWKRFHTQLEEYLLVFYEFSIPRSSIFEPASHRISHPSFTRMPSSLFTHFISLSFHLVREERIVRYVNIRSVRQGGYFQLFYINTTLLLSNRR